jgi:hypothetical protein
MILKLYDAERDILLLSFNVTVTGNIPLCSEAGFKNILGNFPVIKEGPSNDTKIGSSLGSGSFISGNLK